jgi:protein-disulfide isomerase
VLLHLLQLGAQSYRLGTEPGRLAVAVDGLRAPGQKGYPEPMVTWRAKTVILALSALNLNLMCNRSPAESLKDAKGAEPGATVQLEQVDTSGLTQREQSQWSAHVSELLAPCPDQPVSLAQCVRDKRPCDSCVPAAKFLVGQVKQGKAKAQVETAFRLRFSPDEVKSVDVGTSPFEGPADAPVTIVEWADFECPFCAAASPVLHQAVERFQPHVRLVYKYYPLSSHEHAEGAARAAASANKQGKFWDMHSKLFANQDNLERKSLLRLARELHLDEKRFTADLDSEAVADEVLKDRKQAEKFGLRGTPMIFINGRRFEIENFNLAEDLDDWLKLEIQLVTGNTVEPTAAKAPDQGAEPSSAGAANLGVAGQGAVGRGGAASGAGGAAR